MKTKEEFIYDSSKIIFHIAIQPIDKESQKKKNEEYKKIIEERAKYNIEKIK